MIIITAAVDDILISFFKEKAVPYEYLPQISPEELMAKAAEITGLVLTTRIQVTRSLIDAAPKLKWVGRLGSGLEMIDTNYLEEKGIAFFSTPEGNCGAVAEHSLGLLLSLMQNINSSAREVQEYIWLRNENRGWELTGKKVGIIGYGHTGSAFARLLQPFKVEVLAHDKYKKGFARDYIKEAGLDQVKEEAAVISFNLPLTPETKHYAGAAFFKTLAKKPFIINCSRGEVVDTLAIIDALKHKTIAGAGLDVLENEKLNTLGYKQKKEFDYLLQQPNVIITPHIAGYSYEAFHKMSFYLIEKLTKAGLI